MTKTPTTTKIARTTKMTPAVTAIDLLACYLSRNYRPVPRWIDLSSMPVSFVFGILSKFNLTTKAETDVKFYLD